MNGDSHSGGRDSARHSSHRDAYRDERRDRDRDRDRRRRSRSPNHHRSSRRERDYEVDTYSSSRDYREREREERYTARDSHHERGWDRDRGSRRDRRDDDRRRDRDPHEDRRRGGGGGGGQGRERKRSATPPPKKKEPTPDLTDVVSVLERKRRLTQWDIKPPGYENVTAEQAKLSGMFPLPGAPRQQVMDPARLQAFMDQPGAAATTTALKPSNARQSKRLFVYGLPKSATDETVVEFFNLQLNGLNVINGNDPCLSAQVSREQDFALLEFRNPEDATVALAFDGISMEASDDAMDTSNGTANGGEKGLKIQRPQDYIAPTGKDGEEQEGVVPNIIKDSPDKLSVSRLPTSISEEQVEELLSSFGELKVFVLVKDTGTDQSRGIAFCEYAEDVADVAIEGLSIIDFGGAKLVARRACVGVQQVSGIEMGVSAMSMLAGTQSTDLQESRVLQLLNMVTVDELADNDEYEEILLDVREECEKFGKVLDVKVPRPSGTRMNPGVGKIYVKFDDKDVAQKALKTLAGRKFADRTVVATYFSEQYFDVSAW